jgi:hypothetical protein
MKKMNLEEFLILYIEFLTHNTWTKKKHSVRDSIFNVFSSSSLLEITTKRDSPTKKVHFPNDFRVFLVRSNQRGFLSIYRGMWVLMYCTGRDNWDHYQTVVPLSSRWKMDEIKNVLSEYNFTEKLLE